MAKRRKKQVDTFDLQPSPCDLANLELRKTYGGAFTINRELYMELNNYREFINYKEIRDPAIIRKWMLDLNGMAKKLLQRVAKDEQIKTMCLGCGGNANIEMIKTNIHKPLKHILEVCDKFNPEIK